MKPVVAIEMFLDQLENVIYYRKLIATARAPENSHLSVEIAVTAELNGALVWERTPTDEGRRATAQWHLIEAGHTLSVALEKGVDMAVEYMLKNHYEKVYAQYDGDEE